MGKLSILKQNTAGTIASLQTILERYPVLITTDEDLGKTSFSFMLNLLKMFGVTEEDIIEWMSKLLADKKDGSDGLLTVIEAALKVLIISSFKETYTCSVDPVLPDDLMYDIYEGAPRGNGIDIKIEDIDNFGQLSYCPTDKNKGIGQYFYFDNSSYTPLNIYSSCDFNAFLWFVINKGNFWHDANDKVEQEKRKCVWDNRIYYYKKFEKEGCLNGESVSDLNTSKGNFFYNACYQSSLRMIRGVGPKMEILTCEFKEKPEGNVLNIHLCADRYYKTSLNSSNKTNFEFITDYVLSLKLFDSKTLLAQVVNALLGITANLQVEFSLERNVLAKQVRNIVKQVIEEDDTEEINDCYYSFSNETYDSMMEEAMNEYNGEYPSKGETNENIKINAEEILSELYSVESADNLNEETTAITNVIKYVAGQLSSSDEVSKEGKVTFGLGIITDFIEEIVTQLVMQILSPKIMLLYGIEEEIMNKGGENSVSGIVAFFKNFKNLIISLIKKIKDLILQALWDFLMGQIKPLITLFIQKLLLETIYYYKILIEQLISTCTINITNTNNDPLTIDNVVGADIIPSQETPVTEESCRGI